MENIKVIIWGFGAMGKGIAEMINSKQGVVIVGVCDINENVVGTPLSSYLDLSKNEEQEDIAISNDIDKLLSMSADVVFLATDSFTKHSYPKIIKIIENGMNVISTAEEMAYPKANEPDLAKNIDEIAKQKGVSVLGTGINPGFIMDLLAVVLTGATVDVSSLEIKRVNSLSPFGPTVMEEQGVGITLDDFNEKVKNNELAGHVGFKESIYMMADALGVTIEDFQQQMKPIVTSTDRKSAYGEALKGNLAGIDMTAQGYVDKKLFIDMKHPQQIEPEIEGTQTGDYIKIYGKPNINMSITPEIDGGLGTIAMCVNMMPQVINADPGLKTMIDLPVPRAIVGDVRKMIRK